MNKASIETILENVYRKVFRENYCITFNIFFWSRISQNSLINNGSGASFGNGVNSCSEYHTRFSVIDFMLSSRKYTPRCLRSSRKQSSRRFKENEFYLVHNKSVIIVMYFVSWDSLLYYDKVFKNCLRHLWKITEINYIFIMYYHNLDYLNYLHYHYLDDTNKCW